MAHELMNQLDRDGFVLLPQLITSTQLREMQQAFEARLRHMAWNDTLGYERTEMYRHMIQDVLILDQGFLNVALHPLVQQVLKEYLGPHFQLGDAWYDQKAVSSIPREVKLAFYLTDVRSGAFNYIKGSHRKQHPRPIPSGELTNISNDMIVEATGPAGSAFMFDTSGTHRQAMPVLEPRQAVFLNYHDPAIPLQQEDIKYYRYHPLLLNAAFLDNLSMEDRRILGFGDKRNFQHGFERRRRHPILESLNRSLMEATLHVDQALYYPRRALSKARRFLGF
jgi:hypothetical protein